LIATFEIKNVSIETKNVSIGIGNVSPWGGSCQVFLDNCGSMEIFHIYGGLNAGEWEVRWWNKENQSEKTESAISSMIWGFDSIRIPDNFSAIWSCECSGGLFCLEISLLEVLR